MKLITCAVSLGLSATVWGSQLFKEGRTDWKIRIPANAAKPVAYAAEELTNVLFRVSGAVFPIEVSDAGVAEKTIALVAGDETETNEVSTVRTVSDGLLLKGNSPRGALYAAYDFLEHELGCRWFWLGEEGTYLPKKAAFALPAINRTSVTSFKLRGLFIPNGGGSEWMTRNRMNGWTYDWKNIEKCGYVNVFGNHTVGFTGAERKQHPEYEPMLALFEGEQKRRGVAGCWTNPDFLAKMVQVNMDLVEKYHLNILQPYPADVTQRCCCERCKAEGGDAKSAWWRFFEKLLKGLKARDPKLRFAGLAYQEYRDLPKELPGAELMEFVDYAQYNRCYVHAADDPNCVLNKKSFDEMKGWSKLVNVGLYGYEFDIFSPAMYVPFWNMLADQMRTFKKIGLVDVHTEYFLKSGPRTGRPQERLRLSAWIYMRLLADADQPVEPLVKDFCSYVYGAGAEEMAAYHFAAAKAWDTQKAHYTYFLRKPDTAAGCFLNAALIREARTRFAAAKKAIADSADDAAAKARALENVELDEAWFAEWEKLYKIATAGACSVAVADDTPWDECFASKMTSEKGRHQPTDVRVRATDAALEVRVTCTETNMAKLVRGPKGHDAKGIFGTDCIEVFVEPEDGVYRHFVVNAAGGQYDALLQNDATNWNWTVKTELGADKWTATLSIPWSVFGGGKPAKGAIWKMVVDRESRPECCGFPSFVVHDLAGGASLYFCGKVPSGRSFIWFNSEGGNSYLIKDQLANGWNPKYVRYEDAPKTDLSEAPVIVVRMFHEVRKALSKEFYRNQLLPALTNGAIVVIGTYGAPEMWDWFGDPDLRVGAELYNLAVGCGMPGLFRADPKKWEWLDRNKTKKGEELPYLIRRPYGKGLLVLFMENPTVKVLNQQLEDFKTGNYRK